MRRRVGVLILSLTLSVLLLTSFTYIDVGQGDTIGREASAAFLTRLSL